MKREPCQIQQQGNSGQLYTILYQGIFVFKSRLTMICIHKVPRCVPYCTCKVVVWSEKGELKKVSITFIMVTVT